MNPEDHRYLESHEWARKEGDLIVIGISDHAVKQLTDLVFVDLPDAGDSLTRGEQFGEIESVKAVSELNAPMTGEVIEVNSDLVDNLDRIAKDPFGEGWMVKIRPENMAELEEMLDHAAYQKVTEAH